MTYTKELNMLTGTRLYLSHYRILLCIVLLHAMNLQAQVPVPTHGDASGTHWSIDAKGTFQFPARNPDPHVLPSLKVNSGANASHVYISMTFPGIPGLVLDAWCFEGGMADFSRAKETDAGGVVLYHRYNDHPDLLHVTTVKPENGKIVFSGNLRMDSEYTSTTERTRPGSIDHTLVPNICFQVRRSLNFQSAGENAPRASPDPEIAKNYWDSYVSRSFIYTDNGRTFLNDTQRTDTSRDHVGIEADDPRNNPPAVQRYYNIWDSIPRDQGTSSLTRQVLPAMGVVSRDGKYLVASAASPILFSTQAWLDCFHLFPLWRPKQGALNMRAWKIMIYAMENNPDALKKKILHDFPEVIQLQQNPAPLH
jgi:hypothetical protein